MTRFPTSLEADGSDAIHPDPDYSAVYVTLGTDQGQVDIQCLVIYTYLHISTHIYTYLHTEYLHNCVSTQVGYGLAFTLGRGNEIVCHCVDSLRFLVLGKQLNVM